MVLDDRPLWDTMEEQLDGSLIVTFSSPNLDWAARMVLGYGPQAVVLEPEGLRALVSERARAIAASYPSGKKKNRNTEGAK
jgi:predicted DNA-binding transcriptional regulator YafY